MSPKKGGHTNARAAVPGAARESVPEGVVAVFGGGGGGHWEFPVMLELLFDAKGARPLAMREMRRADGMSPTRFGSHT